jgi:trimeric autotransporter adhesin
MHLLAIEMENLRMNRKKDPTTMNSILATWGSHATAVVAIMLCASCVGSSTSSSTVSAIGLSPAPCGLSRTNSVQMSAEATLTDGTKRTLGASEVVWKTENSNLATVSPTGIVVGVNAGIVAITAAYSGATGTLNCTIAP